MKRLVLLGALVFLLSGMSYGQGCSVCTKATAGLDDKSAKGLNGGIIYLAFLPLVMMSTIGFIWWKHNKTGSNGN